jgi:hypothetical protein
VVDGWRKQNNPNEYLRRRVWAHAYSMASKSWLQQEVDENSNATLVMNDDAELNTSYSMSQEVHEDSDATVVMKDDAELTTYSPSGDEAKLKSSILAWGRVGDMQYSAYRRGKIHIKKPFQECN